MLVYRPDGVAEEKEPCDARECVKYCGYTTSPKEDAKEVAKPSDVAKESEPAKVIETPKRGKAKSFFGGKDEDQSAATVSTVASDIEI